LRPTVKNLGYVPMVHEPRERLKLSNLVTKEGYSTSIIYPQLARRGLSTFSSYLTVNSATVQLC